MEWNYYMVKTVLVWFIMIAGKPVGMTFEIAMPNMIACVAAESKIHASVAEIKETGVDIDIYTGCEQK